MQMHATSGDAIERHAPPRFPSTVPPPPPAPELTTQPATLMDRVIAWGFRTHGAPAALLVAVASVGAYFGFRRSLPAPVTVLVQCEPARWGLDFEGDVAVNDPTSRAIATSDPPDVVAVATVDELLRQLATAPGFAVLEAPNTFRALIRPALLADALRAIEGHGDAIVAVYTCKTPDGPRVVLLGAGYLVAVTTYQERAGFVTASPFVLRACSLDSLQLERP